MCLDVHLLVKYSLWSFLNDFSCLIKLCYMFIYLLPILIAFYLFFIHDLYSTCLIFNKVICYVQVFQDTGVYGSSASQILDLGVSEFCLCSYAHIFKSRVCLEGLSWNSQRGRL